MNAIGTGRGVLPRFGGGWMHQFGHVYSLQHEMLNPANNDWFRALELWHSAREEGIALNVSHYSNILRQCVSGSAWEASLGVLKKMKEDGIRADCTGVGASLSCCANAGRWEEAVAVFSRFKESERLKLDSHCYLAVLKVLKAAGKADAAYAVVADQATSRVPLQQETYELLLECAVEAGDDERAAQINDAIPAAFKKSTKLRALSMSMSLPSLDR
jgi:pentatricopeptide repeat protein